MGESFGVVIAVVSSSLGGTGATVTRYHAADADPFILGILRFGLGFFIVLPITLMLRSRWPRCGDWPGVVGLGVMFYGVAMLLYNLSLNYTTAARATLALATLPFLTLLEGALLRIKTMTARKTTGVFIAMAGVRFSLAADVELAPEGA